jgi:hypothetical protein
MNDPDPARINNPVAELGEFFALPTADGDSWLPIITLCNDAAMLREYARRAQSAIAASMRVAVADVPIKAAASSVHMSIAARLLSPVIGATTCRGTIPLLTAKTVFWQRASTHRPELGVNGADCVAVTGVRQSADAIVDSLIHEVLHPLNETMRVATSLPQKVLWGNVASAANGAVTVLALLRPADELRGRALVAALIATDPLRDTAQILEGRFRRRNCCLFYQVPAGGYCGDCVLLQ